MKCSLSELCDIVDGIPVQEGPGIVHGCVQKPLAAFKRSPGDMRRDQAVFQTEERIIRSHGFTGYDVDGGTADLA